jgi:hypothetical protein
LDDVRRNITQAAFTIIRRNLAAREGLYRSDWRGISMPACFRPNEKDEVQESEDGWREPPGYLGEAVRRTKLIPSRANSSRPLQSVDCQDGDYQAGD